MIIGRPGPKHFDQYWPKISAKQTCRGKAKLSVSSATTNTLDEVTHAVESILDYSPFYSEGCLSRWQVHLVDVCARLEVSALVEVIRVVALPFLVWIG